MRLLLVSDLHSEFHDNPLAFVRKAVPEFWTPKNLDFLVLAGDIVVPARQKPEDVTAVFKYLGERAKHVLYVEGNHEFYGSTRNPVVEQLINSMPDNGRYLVNDETTIEGVHFFGGGLWFGNDDRMDLYYRRFMNDFNQIKNLTDWVYEKNLVFKMLGLGLIRPETIVISHHLPHPKSTPEQYAKSVINRFFVSDCTQLITENEPRLWLHGHTHHPCDYHLGKTRVVCNPYGYPQERGRQPYPQVVLEI